jgi:serine/threonine-protein kinase
LLAERYRIVGLLGHGGMGEVYRADDLKLGRTVALKFLPESMERNPARLARFFNEVRTALRVTHPNVCRVYDIGETAGRHFLSMEYVDGEDLATLLRRIGRLPEDRAVRVARQMCAGLAAAHAQGVLHRDLKPANVMLDGRGETKLTDFGLAGAAGDFAGDEIRAGTPAYMAPEQLEGREVTVRSDVYSLGLVLYEIFSGEPAFDVRTPQDVARRRSATPTSLSSRVERLDPAVGRIVDRCLAPDPADRPASATAVAAALPGGDPLAAALAAGETPSPELVAEAGSSAGLRRGSAVAILLAVVLGLAAVAGQSFRVGLASRVRLDLSPAILSHKARELIRAAGWGGATRDRVHTWSLDSAYYEFLRDGSPAPDRWDALGASEPAALVFEYRESPEPLVRFGNGTLGDWMLDPPPTRAGMVEVRLDPTGRLLSFKAVADPFEPAAAVPIGGDAPLTFDFGPFFAAAGLDASAFDPAEPVVRPGTFADRRQAWRGYAPYAPQIEIGIEAASLAGRPVSFRIVEPWDRAFAEAPPPAGPWERMANLAGSLSFVVAVAGAALVAVRNVRLGRGDHRTAFRFGLCLGLGRLLWLLAAHHPGAGAEIELIRGHLAWSTHRFVLAYVFYLAIEPYARRIWPEMLVSWVRLLDGRLRDARVGRDLLVGVAAGGAFATIRMGIHWAPQILGLPDYGLMFDLWTWESLRGLWAALGALAGVHVTSVLDHFVGVMLFLVARVLTRRTWVAVTLVTPVGLVLFNPGIGSPWPYLVGVPLGIALYWMVLFRAGLLAWIVMMCVADALAIVRVTTQVTAWHALPMWITFGSAAVVALWGFRTAVAGQPLFRDEIQGG